MIGDSTATVIGAMIIAPLAIPIQGIAVAIAYGELRAAAAVAASCVAPSRPSSCCRRASRFCCPS